MTFRKVKNPQEYAALVEQFLSARECLKQSVRQNKLGLDESEYQQTQIQQPTINAIEKLGKKIQAEQQPTAIAIKKLTKKLSKKKRAIPPDAKAVPSRIVAEGKAKAEIDEEAEREQSMMDEEIDAASEVGEIDAATEMERIASYLDRATSKRFKHGAMTVDSNRLLGGIPVKLDLQSGTVKVGDREAKLTLPLVELLYGPSSAVKKRDYDSDTIIDYDLLTSHIDKTYLGRSSKYQLILGDKERQIRQENLRKRDQFMQELEQSRMARENEKNLQEQMFMQSLQQSLNEREREQSRMEQSLQEQMAMQERQQMAMQMGMQMGMQSPQEGKGYTLIPQDVDQAAQRLNLLCGSVSAGNDNKMLKNEISMICDHLYNRKVLSKPEIKKLIKRYCF